MLASITPLGERARGSRWWRTATAYVIGSAAGGTLLGAAAALDLRGGPPTIRRQVDERWLVTYRDWAYGAGFGVQLGLGAVTIVTSASVYLPWVLELAAATPAGGALVGAVFGLSRALPLLAL